MRENTFTQCAARYIRVSDSSMHALAGIDGRVIIIRSYPILWSIDEICYNEIPQRIFSPVPSISLLRDSPACSLYPKRIYSAAAK